MNWSFCQSNFAFIDIAICDLVHNVETIFLLKKKALFISYIWKSFLKLEIFFEIWVMSGKLQ